MARKPETGISYYQMDCNHLNNRKIRLLYNDFKADGYWVWQNILSVGYDVNGYYFDCSDIDELTLFADERCKLPVELVKEIISAAVKRSLFNEEIYNTYDILTSDRMQEIFLHATSERRRKGTVLEMIDEYLQVEITDKDKNVVVVPLKKEKSTGKKEITPRKNEVSTEEAERRRKLEEQKAMYATLPKTGNTLGAFITNERPEFIDPYVEFWNLFADKYKKSRVLKPTKDREKKLLIRLRNDDFDFPAIIKKALTSKFIMEESNFLTFDWIIENDKQYLRILEGAYDNAQGAHGEQSDNEPKLNAADQKLLDKLK